MGSIVHYLDSDEWTLELVSGDTLDGAGDPRRGGAVFTA